MVQLTSKAGGDVFVVLCTDSYTVANIALQGEYKVMLDAIKTHSTSAEVVTNGFQALEIIAR